MEEEFKEWWVYVLVSEANGQTYVGVTVDVETTNTIREIRSANVLAKIPGTDPKLGGQAVVVTAHFDHLGKGRPVRNDDIYNGALDNASGTAVGTAPESMYMVVRGDTFNDRCCFDYGNADFQNGNVKRTTAKVKYGYRPVFLAVEPVGESRGGRFVNNA